MNDTFKKTKLGGNHAPSPKFEIRTDARYPRLRELVFDEEELYHFLIKAREYCLREHIFSPPLRCRLAQMFLQHLGANLAEKISRITHEQSPLAA